MKTILNRVNWLFLLVSVMLILWADAMAYVDFLALEEEIRKTDELASLSLFLYILEPFIKQIMDCVKGGFKKWKAYAESYILIMLGMNLLMMCFVPSGTGSALHQFNLAIDNVIIFLYVILAVAQYIIERNESKHS